MQDNAAAPFEGMKWSRPRIKICGITNVHDAELAVQLGADALGFNVYYRASKRWVAPSVAMRIASGALPPFVEPVLLFVNEPLVHALELARSLSYWHPLNTIQWHGDAPELPPPPPWRFIPAFPIVDAASLDKVSDYLARCRAASGLRPAAVLLDGHSPGLYGGTGQTAPWQLLADFDPGVPVILAGGLTPDNVAEAVRIVRPYAVDVASGVEAAPGVKDPEKLRRFIDNVRGA
jgi:phosphoribosylanthranilate isomerase